MRLLEWLRSKDAVVDGGDGMPLLELALGCVGATDHLVRVLQAVGALEVETDEFQTELVRMHPDSLQRCSSLLLVAQPQANVLHFRFPDALACSSKMVLVLEALHRGWELVPGPLAPRRQGAPLQLEAGMLARSHLYLRTMLDDASIYVKGANCIHHKMPAAYYKCLLNLPSLETLCADPDLCNYRNADFEAIALGRHHRYQLGGRLPLADAPCEFEGADGLGVLAEGEQLALLDQEVPPEIAEGVLMEPQRAPRSLGAFSFTLHGKVARFDNFSHSSGNQRGYITCAANSLHGGCYKYRFVRDFATHQECAAWLMAWDMASDQCSSKREHLAFSPPPEAVQKVLSFLPEE